MSTLEDLVRQAGGDPSRVSTDPAFWADSSDLVNEWLEAMARALAHAAVSTLAVLDFDDVVIDGAFPADVRQALLERVERELDKLDLQGVRRPSIEPGHLGDVARAVGAASQLIYREYAINQNTLMRS